MCLVAVGSLMMFLRGRLTRSNYVIPWFANRVLFSIFVSYAVAVLLCSSHPFCFARDTITDDTPITESETLVSSGGRFELGFFRPSPKGTQRYVGIWYHQLSPRTVVWVANRENPVVNSTSTGSLAIQDGDLHVLDTTGNTYWSTGAKTSKTVTLMDSGNLVLSEGNDPLAMNILWQSFQSPTDTFIPGMKMDNGLELTSWRGKDDPGSGNFSLKQDQDGGKNQYVILKGKSLPYWKGGEPSSETFFSSDEIPPAVTYLLSNLSTKFPEIYKNPSRNNVKIPPPSGYNYTRLVISITGNIQYYNYTKQWKLIWSAPQNLCSVYNFCGKFGTCNINNWPLVCKCLPGFNPQFAEKWNAGDFSGGCKRESEICGKNDTFLNLTMMKVGKPDSLSHVDNETECRNTCLDNCQCQAYTYAAAANNTRRDYATYATSALCRTWLTDLNNLEEEYGRDGHNLSVRIASSDLESTVRDCKPCGTTTIPYPLSTGPDCGDPMYFCLNCNSSTGQVNFLVNFLGRNGIFRVISINSSTQRFIIKAQNKDNCDPRNRVKSQMLNLSPPFNVTNWCKVDLANTAAVELGWELPQEPTCTTSADCRGWPHSTCNPARDGKKRCLCNASFQWNGFNLNCTQASNLQQPPKPTLLEGQSRSKLPLSLILIVLAAVITSVFFLACVISIYIWRRKITKRQDKVNRAQLDSERRVQELMDRSEFKEEDETSIDVPFFDWQRILEATDNFSNANKLGQGGYGPVYKGKFLGGQEIAVKRLSRVSGQGLQEFRNEVVLIAKLQHRNLVRLKGYCMKGEEKILLYEYMPNKSLDSFIFDHTKSMFLNWEMRFNIILGTARGLLYLHQDSRLRIIHRDLKTSNILLDEEMNPKISDFGLARIVGGKETESNTNTIVGTYGYMSPEYALDGTFSVKSDVFSFGVVLLEIISGKKNTGFYQSKQTFSLINYAWRLWTENKVLDLMDKTLEESCNESQFIKCVNAGLLCIQEDPSDRPSMSNVITMLDSETATSPAPKQPAFLMRRGNSSTASSSSKPETISEITTTLVEGR